MQEYERNKKDRVYRGHSNVKKVLLTKHVERDYWIDDNGKITFWCWKYPRPKPDGRKIDFQKKKFKNKEAALNHLQHEKRRLADQRFRDDVIVKFTIEEI